MAQPAVSTAMIAQVVTTACVIGTGPIWKQGQRIERRFMRGSRIGPHHDEAREPRRRQRIASNGQRRQLECCQTTASTTTSEPRQTSSATAAWSPAARRQSCARSTRRVEIGDTQEQRRSDEPATDQ